MQADWRRIDPEGPEVGALIEEMAEAGVAMDPTLAIQRSGEGHPVDGDPLGEIGDLADVDVVIKDGRIVVRR